MVTAASWSTTLSRVKARLHQFLIHVTHMSVHLTPQVLPLSFSSALVLCPVGRDLLPAPLVVGVVPVARAHDGPGALGFQCQAVARRPVVHLLLALPVLPGAGVVAELAPRDQDAAAVLVNLRRKELSRDTTVSSKIQMTS